MNAPDRLVADACERLFAGAALVEGFDAPLWDAFRASGMSVVLADAGKGDAVSMLRASGYHAAALPVAEAALADWIAARAGLPAEERRVSVVLHAGTTDLRFGRETASGRISRVPWGRQAQVLYAAAVNGAETALVRIELGEAAREEGENMAGEPRDTLSLESCSAQLLTGTTVDEALAMGALLRAAQMVGAMERSLDLALEHASTRAQFGRPIGQFQAVQQMLAQLAGQAAAAAAAVDLAAQSPGQGILEAGVAKSRAGEAAGFVAEMAHQVIAAMGFTREHSLHRCTRRLWSWRDECGNEAWWNARLGDAAAAAGAAGLWPMIADGRWPAGAAP